VSGTDGSPWLCCMHSGECDLILGGSSISSTSSTPPTPSSTPSAKTSTPPPKTSSSTSSRQVASTPSPQPPNTPARSSSQIKASTPSPQPPNTPAQSSSQIKASTPPPSPPPNTPTQPSLLIKTSSLPPLLSPNTPAQSSSLIEVSSSPPTSTSGPSPPGPLTQPVTHSHYPHAPVPHWNGTGPLLNSYCVTAEFTLLCEAHLTAVYYIPVIGCIGDKLDCCPSITTVNTTETETVIVVQPTTVTEPVTVTETPYFFPTITTGPQSLIELPNCPDDYVTIDTVCCPSGYSLWNSVIGGITPCYSALPSYAIPTFPPSDPSTITVSGSIITTTSTVVDIVYAMQYPIANHSKPGLPPRAKAGIGVGCALAGLAGLVGLVYWLIRGRRRPSVIWSGSHDMSSNNHGLVIQPP
jgi:hypothetical protein